MTRDTRPEPGRIAVLTLRQLYLLSVTLTLLVCVGGLFVLALGVALGVWP